MDGNKHDNIDDLFRERFSNHESPYVPGAWEKLDKMLTEDSRKTWSKNAKRFTLASLAGAIVLAGSVVAYISGYDTRTATFTDAPAQKEQPAAIARQKETVTQPQAITEADLPAGNQPASLQPNDNAASQNAAPVNKNTANNGNKQNTTPQQDINTSNDIVLADDDEKKEGPVNIETAEPVETAEIIEIPETPYVLEPAVKNRMQDIALLEMMPAPGAETIDFEKINLTTQLEKDKLAIDSASRAQRRLDEVKSFYRLQYGFYAGANFNKVLSNERTGTEFGSGLLAGIFAGKNFSTRWAAGIELNYLRRNSNSISRSISQTDIFFHNATTNFYIVTKSFDYLQVPISGTYRLNSKHSFNFGLVGGVMLNAHSDRIEQYIVEKERTTELTTVTRSVHGVYEDMSRFTYGAWAGYEYRLPGIYSLGVRYNQAVNDITKESYFKDGKRHAPADIQVYLKVNLNK